MVIQSKKIFLSGTFLEAQIELKQDKILAVHPYGTKTADKDFGENMVIPGIIDVHCHGGLAFDTNDAEKEGLLKWAKNLINEGVTSFCPTTVTQAEEVLIPALRNVAEVMEEEYDGAEMLGIHFEGPFLNMKRKGAQPPEYIVKPDVEQFKKYQEAAKGNIKVMTMACEEDEDFRLTRYASECGVCVSMGHSAGTYQNGMMGIANGARGITHTYNGMNGLHHREPALVGIAMTSKDTYAEIICDGNHVVWPAIRALVESKGRDYCIIVDDALCAKGCAPGEYFLGGHQIEVRDNGSAYLAGTDTLAGGTLRLNEAIRNLVEHVQIPIDVAIQMATLNPARYLRVDDRKGRICAGYDADLAILDEHFEILDVFYKGKELKR